MHRTHHQQVSRQCASAAALANGTKAARQLSKTERIQMSKITITIQGGTGSTDIDTQAWAYMSPARRVLFLHERLRKVTKGEAFDVIRTEKHP
jgi:hypothetical protein